MQWYRVIKAIKGRHYYCDQKTYRQGAHVRTLNKYIGPCEAPPSKSFYHGTLEVFDTFDFDKAGKNTGWDNAKFGIFFTDNRQMAEGFPELVREAGDRRPVQVKEVHLNIRNPIDLTLHGIFNNEKQAPALVELLGGEAGLSPKDALKHLNATIEIGELSEMREALYGDIANKSFFRKHGYDGIVSTYGTDENGHEVKEYVAFELTQIKMRYD